MTPEAKPRPEFPKSYITIDGIVVPTAYWTAPWWRKMLWRMLYVPLPSGAKG